ncbi:epoxide hydrolase family protein [Leifsonia poae]|nr:epoxide hydrolase family protein [Leifsonia poae]
MMDDRIRPFAYRASDRELAELRRRLRRTRWPDRETVGDWSQGVPLAFLQDLCAYWADGYDWRATEARLARIPQFVTTIDGVDIQFLHVRSREPDATPIVLTHGWPGSFFEFEAAIGALTDPVAHGGEAGDAFDVVVPSVPGYGFSGKPATTGWGIHRIADTWAELMARLGYRRFIAAGSDWGTSISTSLALEHPDRMLGIHLVPPLAAPDRDAPDLTRAERQALAELDERGATGSGYSAVHASRPQTIGYALVDSPAGLAAWIVEKLWEWSDRDPDARSALTRDRMLDDITLYWLTGTAASSARLYAESIAEVSAWFTTANGPPVTVPTAATVFPREVPRPSRRWAERRFTNIVHWGEPPHGGHFGAWEQPDLFVAELRAGAAAIAAAHGAPPSFAS